MARNVHPTNQFKRDAKKHVSELITPAWAEVLHYLCNDFELAEKYCDHGLTGEWNGCGDCHVKPDLVLIYEKQNNDLILHRLGSHSDLFGKSRNK